MVAIRGTLSILHIHKLANFTTLPNCLLQVRLQIWLILSCLIMLNGINQNKPGLKTCILISAKRKIDSHTNCSGLINLLLIRIYESNN